MDIKQKVQEIEYQYWLDKKELGKVMIIASLSILVVSIHAVYTVNGAVEQAQESNERMQTTARLVQSDGFQNSMDNLADTSVNLGDESISDIVQDLEYAAESVEDVEEVSQELEQAQTTYQWTVLVGILGLVAGITAIYI